MGTMADILMIYFITYCRCVARRINVLSEKAKESKTKAAQEDKDFVESQARAQKIRMACSLLPISALQYLHSTV